MVLVNYHFVKNVIQNFQVPRKEFRAFHLVVKDLDTNYWDRLNKYSHESRIYPISTSQQNLVLIFNKRELQALKELINKSD